MCNHQSPLRTRERTTHTTAHYLHHANRATAAHLMEAVVAGQLHHLLACLKLVVAHAARLACGDSREGGEV